MSATTIKFLVATTVVVLFVVGVFALVGAAMTAATPV